MMVDAATRAAAIRICAGLLIVGLAIWLFASGTLSQLDPGRIRDQLRGLGGLGPLAFVAAFALLQPLGPSGHLFVVGASLVWDHPQAFALSMVGAALSQATAFGFYRYLAHDWAQRRIPKRLRRYDEALARRPFRSVLVLRLLTFTWPLVPALLGVSRVRFGPMMVATVLGLAPMIAIDTWLGASISDWLFA